MAERKTQTITKCEAKVELLREQVDKMEQRQKCEHSHIVVEIYCGGWYGTGRCSDCRKIFTIKDYPYDRVMKKLYKRLAK